MLPIEALSYRLEDLLKAAMPEHADRIHLNRTLAFAADEVPAINITQGTDTPNNDVSDFQRSGWTASFDIQIVCSGSSERAIVSELNSFRLNIYRIAVMLLVLFTLWLTAAQALYESIFGPAPPMSLGGLLDQVFNTPGGMTLLIVGNLLGVLFALVTLCTTVIAFPLLLDRDVGALVAVETSFRAVMKNPFPMLAWGVIVGIGLFLGSLPLFVGLAVVIPIFGHATWHLYRKLVEPASAIRGL